MREKTIRDLSLNLVPTSDRDNHQFHSKMSSGDVAQFPVETTNKELPRFTTESSNKKITLFPEEATNKEPPRFHTEASNRRNPSLPSEISNREDSRFLAETSNREGPRFLAEASNTEILVSPEGELNQESLEFLGTANKETQTIGQMISNIFFVVSIIILLGFALHFIISFSGDGAPEAILVDARRYRDEGKFQNSRQAYEAYIAGFGDNPDGYIEYAQLLLENGFFPEAISVLDQLNQRVLNARQKSEYHLIRGRIHDKNGEFLAALLSYRAAYGSNMHDQMTALMLITANIRISERTPAIEREYNSVRDQLQRLTSDSAVFQFIEANKAYINEDYSTAFDLFEQSASSEISFVMNESFRQMMNLAESIEPDVMSTLSRKQQIMHMVEDHDEASMLLDLFIRETYAVALFQHIFREDVPERYRAEMIKEAEDIFLDLLGKEIDSPNIFICIASILRNNGEYYQARNILEQADRVIEDNILILINLAYAEADFQNNSDRDFEQLKKLNDRIEKLFSESPAYTSEMNQFRDFIKRINQMGLI